MKNKKLIVITGNQLSHKYFINQLNKHFNLSAIFIEHFEYPIPNFTTEDEEKVWNEFFFLRKKTEGSLLHFSSRNSTLNRPMFFNIEKGALNDNKTLQSISSFNPTKIIIFGTSLLQAKYLELFPNCIFNLHVGLSQYYRGSSCNFWPIYDLRPNLIGATIHFVSTGIDDGKIVMQDKIKLNECDSEFELMIKPIILGTSLMIKAINKDTSNLITAKKTVTKGKLCLIRDFSPQAILKVREHVSSGKLKNKIIETLNS
jgi:methionyl-tRNA formyltransferase